ncbi:hypothetical protein PLESTF_000987900 [Pleodorina starrii]|nr:hypothetical protein PLESTM_001883300 [Pleodorina starrii]GLC70497.1 hypothetical protein PLESTF_000987900 [Pleodorina starrii]
MRAVVLTGFGEPKKCLKYREDHPKPVRKPGEVLVAVKATGVNPAECHIRNAKLPKAMITIPQILGCDLAGVVLEADPTSKFKVGDRVVSCTGQFLRDPWGTYAEYVSVREALVAPLPAAVSFVEGAALPIAGMTAWQALAPSMPLGGKRVLVLGGAGGVGHFAVQIAKTQGAYVAATCSTRNTDFVTRELGADRAIDYTQEKLETAAGEPYDVIVDLVGAEPYVWGLLRKRGRLAAVSFDQTMQGRQGWGLVLGVVARMMRLKLASALGLCPQYDSVVQDVAPDKGLIQLAALVSEGRVRVHVEVVEGLQGLVGAHEGVQSGRTRGKVVIQVAED